MTAKELLHVLQQEKFDVKDYHVTVDTGGGDTEPVRRVELDEDKHEIVFVLESEIES